MRVIVQLRSGESPRVESNGVNITGVRGDKQNSGNGIVQGVSFDSNLAVWFPVMEDWGRGKGLLQGIERLAAVLREAPWNGLPSEASEG